MDQIPLIVDTANDAVRDTVRSLGGSKKIGPQLWPTKKPDRAEKDLDDCLNPNNDRKLSFEEILMIARLGRDKGIHLIAGFVCFDVGYAPPVPIDHEDERAELQRRYIQSVEEQKRITARMERLPR